MDSVLQQLVEKFDEYVGDLIDVAGMSEDDKSLLKTHLLAAQDILVRNGETRLKKVIGVITEGILARF